MDKLELNINQIFENGLGLSKSPSYSLEILNVDGKQVCHVEVLANKSSKTWTKFGRQEYFFIRQGNGTKALSGEEADQYWLDRINI